VIRRVVLSIAVLFAAACQAPEVEFSGSDAAAQPTGPSIAPVRSGDAVVVMNGGGRDAADDSFVDCVRESLRGALSADAAGPRVMRGDDLRDALYPWFEEPLDEKAAAALLARSLTRQRMAEIGVRYVAIVNGATTSRLADGVGSGGSGVMLCGAGAGGAGCFGLMMWERRSSVSATLWDMKAGGSVGSLNVAVSGTNVMPALVLPVPLIMPTESAACSTLGERLQRLLTTGEAPPPAKAPDGPDAPDPAAATATE